MRFYWEWVLWLGWGVYWWAGSRPLWSWATLGSGDHTWPTGYSAGPGGGTVPSPGAGDSRSIMTVQYRGICPCRPPFSSQPGADSPFHKHSFELESWKPLKAYIDSKLGESSFSSPGSFVAGGERGEGERAVVRGGGSEAGVNLTLIWLDHGSEPRHHRRLNSVRPTGNVQH